MSQSCDKIFSGLSLQPGQNLFAECQAIGALEKMVIFQLFASKLRIVRIFCLFLIRIVSDGSGLLISGIMFGEIPHNLAILGIERMD